MRAALGAGRACSGRPPEPQPPHGPGKLSRDHCAPRSAPDSAGDLLAASVAHSQWLEAHRAGPRHPHHQGRCPACLAGGEPRAQAYPACCSACELPVLAHELVVLAPTARMHVHSQTFACIIGQPPDQQQATLLDCWALSVAHQSKEGASSSPAHQVLSGLTMAIARRVNQWGLPLVVSGVHWRSMPAEQGDRF